MWRNHQLSVAVLSLIVLVLGSIIILALRVAAYSSFVEPPAVDISYILSTRKEPKRLPFGDTVVLPEFRYVALYGSPAYSALGALGEQSIEESIARARKLARSYQSYSEETIIPTFEIITTIASATPTENGDYSQEVDIAKIRPWIDAAYDAGMYVLLDLQPGRTDFLTQAKEYRELLLEPHVGLALDPEWRLKSNQVHLQQIGSVSVSEVNKVSNWLANLTEEAELPQKMILLHQFRLDMITNREKLDTSREELAYVVQMDGQGSTAGKDDTWQAITHGAPENVYFGWKNFYDEDEPLRSPADTMKITPKPWYISYQ